ncbi:MAG: hypothetical protein K0R01_1698, partial [Mycobacterium sp.]|nr:hypothetical protein [Mycobacterium sp.]
MGDDGSMHAQREDADSDVDLAATA